tara:strand:- start:81 stop:710 length:630 start_codon:yes stop_codon:yes gene_type:complete
MTVGLQLTQNAIQFEKLVLNALADELNSFFTKRVQRAMDPVRQAVRAALRKSNTIIELSSGAKLRGALGIPSGQDPTTSIIEAVANSAMIIPKPIKVQQKSFSGGFSINVQPENFSNLLNQSFGSVTTKKAAKLPWLNWLLTRGSSIIVADYGVKYSPGSGRSGHAKMQLKGTPFSIDPVHSGTIANNFVSRALEEDADNIIKAIMRAF